MLGPIDVEYLSERSHPRDINKVYSIYNGMRVRGLHEHSRPRALGSAEGTRGWASLGPLSTYTPTQPYFLSPVSLNLLTSHSLPFVNNICMEATPSPAERSRTILDILSELGTPCSPFIIMSTEENPVLHTKAKEGFDDSSCVRGLRP